MQQAFFHRRAQCVEEPPGPRQPGIEALGLAGAQQPGELLGQADRLGQRRAPVAQPGQPLGAGRVAALGTP